MPPPRISPRISDGGSRAFRLVAGQASYPRRLVMWIKRRPAAAFAAGMTTAFVIASCLGAVRTIQADRAEAATAHAEANTANERMLAAQQVAEANQRELDLTALTRLRLPIRTGGWSEIAWAKTREFAAGRPDDGRFQGQFTTLVDGLDVRRAKSFAKAANMLAFDSEGKRLLMAQRTDGQSRPCRDPTFHGRPRGATGADREGVPGLQASLASAMASRSASGRTRLIARSFAFATRSPATKSHL